MRLLVDQFAFRTPPMTEPAEHPASDPRPLVSLSGISKNFGAVSALTEVDLEIFPGEILALVGDNGAGKSTLIKILAGVLQPSSGSIAFDGAPVTMPNPSAALRLGIATVFQDLALCENLDVVANIFLGRELSPLQLDEVAMEVRAWTLLASSRRAFRAYGNRSPPSPAVSVRPSRSPAPC